MFTPMNSHRPLQGRWFFASTLATAITSAVLLSGCTYKTVEVEDRAGDNARPAAERIEEREVHHHHYD